MKIEEIAAKHEWDFLSNYCIHCGVALFQDVNNARPCTRADNVVAISHLVCGARLRDLIDVDALIEFIKVDGLHGREIPPR